MVSKSIGIQTIKIKISLKLLGIVVISENKKKLKVVEGQTL